MDREFDLSGRVSSQTRLLWGVIGVIQIANGLIHLIGGEHIIFGVISMSFGLLLLPGSFLPKRINRFVITFSEDTVFAARGLYTSLRVDWDSMSKIKLYSMSVEFVTHDGVEKRISFGDLGYADIKEVKPQIFEAIREAAQAKGIDLMDRST